MSPQRWAWLRLGFRRRWRVDRALTSGGTVDGVDPSLVLWRIERLDRLLNWQRAGLAALTVAGIVIGSFVNPAGWALVSGSVGATFGGWRGLGPGAEARLAKAWSANRPQRDAALSA